MAEISVIIPVYNGEKYLPDALASIKIQNFDDYEIVFVNDGSTDGSAKILTAAQAEDPRIKIISQANAGTNVARKNGVLASTGKYVMFLDPDDEFAPDTFNTLLPMLEEGRYDMVQFGAELVISENVSPEKQDQYNFLKDFLAVTPRELNGTENILNDCFQPDKVTSYNLCTRIVRGDLCREAFSGVEDLRILTGEDGYAYLLAASFSNSVKIISTPLYRYYFTRGISGNGISAQKFLRILEDYRNLHGALTRLKQNKPKLIVHADRLATFLANNIREVLPMICTFSPEDYDRSVQAYSETFKGHAAFDLAWVLRKKLDTESQLYLELEKLQVALKNHRASLSWKITKPLRFLSNLLHRGR